MSNETMIWWALLCAVSLFNVLAWSASAALAHREARTLQPWTRNAVRLQMLLSAGYVLGCAYRSVFPVYDVGRMVLVDSWLSSVMVGRSVATVAELCFAGQWALLVHGMARHHDHRFGMTVGRLVMPLIVAAEICSWHSVLTTSNLGHVFEESLWALTAAALVLSMVLMWRRCQPDLRPALAAAAVIGVGYVIYMCQVDVPMYWARWTAEAQHGRQALTLAQGLADASGRWIVSHSWAAWRSEVVWMTLYFSVAVWMSIAMMHLPRRLVRRADSTPAARAARLQTV